MLGHRSLASSGSLPKQEVQVPFRFLSFVHALFAHAVFNAHACVLALCVSSKVPNVVDPTKWMKKTAFNQPTFGIFLLQTLTWLHNNSLMSIISILVWKSRFSSFLAINFMRRTIQPQKLTNFLKRFMRKRKIEKTLRDSKRPKGLRLFNVFPNHKNKLITDMKMVINPILYHFSIEFS